MNKPSDDFIRGMSAGFAFAEDNAEIADADGHICYPSFIDWYECKKKLDIYIESLINDQSNKTIKK